MPAFKHNNMNFSVFKNDYKEEGDARPDYTGKGVINDKDVKLALWAKTSNDGTPFFSGKIEHIEPEEPKEKGSTEMPWDKF